MSEPKYLTYTPQPDFFIGRDELLDKIRYTFNYEGNLVILYGMGGIGKTTLASEYAWHKNYRKLYTHIAWIETSNSILESFVYNEELLANLGITDKIKEVLSNQHKLYPDIVMQAFGEIRTAIHHLSGLTLIVLDNLNNENELIQHKKDLQSLQCDVLITSRYDCEDMHPIRVNSLVVEASRGLFWRHYTRGNAAMRPEDQQKLDELLICFDHHTLFTEMLGKNAHKMGYSLDEILEYVRNFSLRDESWQIEVGTGQSGQTHGMPKETIAKYMIHLFRDIKNINEEELSILRLFSVLPTKSYSIDDLADFFDLNKLNLQKKLSSLDSSGIPVRQGNLWKMHPLFKEVCLSELQPYNADNCGPVITKILYPLNIKYNRREEFNALQYLPIGLEVLRIVDNHHMQMTELIINTAELYLFLGRTSDSFFLANKLLASLSPEDITVINRRFAEMFSGKNIDIEPNELDEFIINPIQFLNISTLSFSLYYAVANFSEAKRFAMNALDMARKLHIEDATLAGAQNNLSIVLMELGEIDAAEQLLKDSLEIYNKINDNNIDLGQYYSNFGMLLEKKGEYEKAKECLLSAIKHYKKNLGEDHPEISFTYSNLGSILLHLEEFTSAKSCFENAINILIYNFGEDNIQLCTPFSNLGHCLKEMNQLKEAQQFLEKAFNISKNHYGLSSLLTLRHADLLALFYWQQLEYEKAWDMLQQCLDCDNAKMASEQRFVASAYAKFGTLSSMLNQIPEAIKNLEIALQFEENHSPFEFPEIAIWKNNLSGVYREIGEIEKANKLEKESYNIYQSVKNLRNPTHASILEILDRTIYENY